tara:strand:- start:127 stop:366 length:240 start_codon:yes stop_codon:yes gene_type:complete
MNNIERNIRILENEKISIDKSINNHKKKFIDEIKNGLGKEIIEEINNPKEKKQEVKEEKEQSKGLFRTMKKWISSLLEK